MPRGKNECYQGRREQHLDNSNVSLITTKYLGEWVRVVYSKALGGSYKTLILAGIQFPAVGLVVPYLQPDSCSLD